MLSVQEMSAWSTAEIRGEIERLLPEGWVFEAGWDREAQQWTSRFYRLEPDNDDPVVEWVDWHTDERINLFNAYGYLWVRRQPKPPLDSPWRRRKELTTEHVRKKALELADPPDLDPEEVKSVYESVRGEK